MPNFHLLFFLQTQKIVYLEKAALTDTLQRRFQSKYNEKREIRPQHVSMHNKKAFRKINVDAIISIMPTNETLYMPIELDNTHFRVPLTFTMSKNEIKNIRELKNKKFIAFTGIGNPNNFFKLLLNNNIKITKTIIENNQIFLGNEINIPFKSFPNSIECGTYS